MNINDLKIDCHKIAKDKGFWDSPRNTGELLMLIVSEAAEALEADRKGRRADLDNFAACMALPVHEQAFVDPDLAKFKKAFEDNIKDTFEDEIADVFIRLFDLCGGMDIDINRHIKLKMQYNKTREKLHGKKY